MADLTRPCGGIVWRGTLLKFSDRNDMYVKLTRMGKQTKDIGFSSVELITLRDLVKDLIMAEEEARI